MIGNNLTPAEAEMLTVLAEEAGTIVQVVSKILRHGYDSSWNTPTNRRLLEMELGDLILVTNLMVKQGSISKKLIDERIAVKPEKLRKYLHHNDI